MSLLLSVTDTADIMTVRIVMQIISSSFVFFFVLFYSVLTPYGQDSLGPTHSVAQKLSRCFGYLIIYSGVFRGIVVSLCFLSLSCLSPPVSLYDVVDNAIC